MLPEEGHLLRIFIGEIDKEDGMPLYEWIIKQVRRTPPPDSLGFTGLLTEYDLRRLRQKGLTDPVNQLKADLMNQADLILQEGVLGGTMNFFPDQIWVLSSR